MPHNSQHKPTQNLKAGALLCPVCCVEYIEIEVDFEVDGTVLRNVKLLRCPICQDEQFTPEQGEDIEKRTQRSL